jgi:hypothetical protein
VELSSAAFSCFNRFPPFFSLIFGNSVRYRSCLAELPKLFFYGKLLRMFPLVTPGVEKNFMELTK